MRAPVGVFVGLCTLDVIQEIDRPPAANEKVTARRQVIAAGGPAANAAVTFAALGGRAVLITALGNGAAADIARTDLRGCGVQVLDIAPEQRDRLAVSSVLVTAGGGQRSVVSTDAGAPVDQVPDLSAAVAAADIVLLDGHHPVLTKSAAEWSTRARRPLVLDAGRWRPVLEHVLPAADAVLCSADFRCPDSTDAVSSARMLVEAGVPTVVVTRGSRPVLWWAQGRSGAVPVPRVDAVDTSGVGDAFHGAYCYVTSRGVAELAERLTVAARFASHKCAHFGTRSWLRDVRQRG